MGDPMTDTAGRERTEPRTEAGRALAKKLTGIGRMPFSGISFPDIEDDIIAIEEEAARTAAYNPSLDEALNSGDGSYRP
jgi:hypothetical protein